MIVNKGDKMHIISRRLFEGDLRRHFAGEVIEVSGDLAQLAGYAYIFNPNTNEYVRMPETRQRIFGLASAELIINMLPRDSRLEDLVYLINRDKRLVVTDLAGYSLDINEFGATR